MMVRGNPGFNRLAVMAEDEHERQKDMPRHFADLPEAAQRALKEAEARRKAADAKAKAAQPRELNGRGGDDPVRYGDWEVKGIAVDF